VYDNPGRVALLALHTLCRMCKLQVLKAVEKFDSRRLHHLFPTTYRPLRTISRKHIQRPATSLGSGGTPVPVESLPFVSSTLVGAGREQRRITDWNSAMTMKNNWRAARSEPCARSSGVSVPGHISRLERRRGTLSNRSSPSLQRCFV
jgi:hypothetical protein